MKTYYAIRNLKVSVYLGVYDEERERPVEIPVTIELAMNYAPKGQISDDLVDTMDYSKICTKVTEGVSGKVFNLIERLVGAVYEEVKEILPAGIYLRVSAVKEIIPAPWNCEGIKYSYTDDPEKFRQVV